MAVKEIIEPQNNQVNMDKSATSMSSQDWQNRKTGPYPGQVWKIATATNKPNTNEEPDIHSGR